MLETRKSPGHDLRNEFGDHGSRFGPYGPVIMELQVRGDVTNNETPEATIANQDVGAQPQDKAGHPELPGRAYGSSEFVG